MRHRRAVLAAAFVAVMPWAPAAAQLPGPVGPESGPFRKQLWLIPSPQFNVRMHAYVHRPRGQGPFPLAVISHGSSEVAEDRARYDPSGFDTIAAWLARQGYVVVVPQRPGHGRTGGAYEETIRSCEFPAYGEAAFAAAASIESTVLFMMTYPFVERSRVLLVGQSSGGLASLAFASRWIRIPQAVILFATGNGGRHARLPNRNCAPNRLVSLVGELGARIRVRTLWLYARNDTYFGPDLSRRMVEEFRAAGGPAEYHLFPAVSDEGHFLIHSPPPVWAPVVQKFLAAPS